MSKKEEILVVLDELIAGIKAGSSPSLAPTYVYENTVSYVDRQYLQFNENDVLNHEMPWVVINNEGEEITAFPSKHFESKLKVQIVGFVKVTEEHQDLDTLMNSLQRDIFVAILSDVALSGKASFMTPVSVITVPEMINPYGGFVINLEITYQFDGLNY